jgi:hypothetical protein
MLRDPFTVDDEAILYVPRAASERVLGELEQALQRGTHPVALIGAVGIGKSLLFKVVAQRLMSQACCVPVRYEGWSVAELCQWVIRELDARETLEGERALAHRPTLVKFREWMQRERSYLQKGDPETALLELAGDLQGRGFPIVLLVDDADSMKPDTAARLVELTAQANGGLVLGLALTEGAPGAGALRGALAPGLKEIRFFEPMTLEETMVYVKERLAKVGASRELRACLDESRIRRLYRYTEGNPRRVHGEVGLLHLELSRVRAGLPLREGEAARFETIEEPVASPRASFEAQALEASTPEPAPLREPELPWRLRDEQAAFAPTVPTPEPEPEIDEAEAVLAALTPVPLPEPAPEDVSPEEISTPAAREPEPVVLAESADEPEPAEVVLEAAVEAEPVLEGLAELGEGSEEIELEVVAIEEVAEPAPIEPPTAIPPTPFALAPEIPAVAEVPETVEPEPAAVEEPHLIDPETLAQLRASVAEVEAAERRQEPEPALRVVSVDEQAPNAELYAEVRRDWEDLTQRSAPLASVSLPPAAQTQASAKPELKRRSPQSPAEPGTLSKAAAAAVVLAAGVLLTVWLSSPDTEPLPEVAAQQSEPGAETPAESRPVPAPAQPAPQPQAPAARPEASAPAAEPSMIATNINAKPWARIEIDGADQGETPLGEVMLSEGTHSFRAFMPDGRVIERTEKISRANSRILFE